MNHYRSLRAVFVLLALAGFLAALAPFPLLAGEENPALRSLVHEGEPAPSFTLDRLEGGAFPYVPGGGTPSLLLFWSAFCPLCRELTPELVALSNRHRESLRFVSVNLDGHRFRSAIRSFIEDFAVPYPVLLDEIRNDLFVASDAYGVSKTPTVILVDGDGIVRGAYAAEQVPLFLREFDQGSRRFRRKSSMPRPAAKPAVFHDR